MSQFFEHAIRVDDVEKIEEKCSEGRTTWMTIFRIFSIVLIAIQTIYDLMQQTKTERNISKKFVNTENRIGHGWQTLAAHD